MMLEALKLAHKSMQPVIEIIKEMREQLGKPKVEDFPVFLPADEVIEEVRALATDKLAAVIVDGPGKKELKEGRNAVRAEVEEIFAERLEEGVVSAKDIGDSMDSVFKEVTRARILADGIRPDGRETTEIRNISAQVGRLPRTHGSGLFMRGETHVLTLTTLGTPGDAQRLDTLQPISTKKYMHHYNFPPYSTGEAYPLRGTKRREVGHGALAERALKPVIPENFPYTLRLVSEAVSSNGSTSMGSVCGSTLSLMDAGVPITAPVSGIAMGLIQDPESGAYRILSDIQGLEDALGDMDFKIAGTEHGVTALQMDLKIKGLDFSILGEALEQAREGRMFIMSKMLEALPSPREEMSEFAPRILTVNIDPEKIGMLIGPGGKTIRGLQENFEVKIDVEEDGTVFVSGAGVGAEHARDEVERLTETIEVGKIYTGTVVRVEAYGAFVNIKPGLDGMVHISQLADYRVDKVEDIAKLGDELTAMVIDVDPGGKVRMSRQAVLEGWTAEEARKRDSGGRSSGGGGRGGDRRGGGGRDRRR
jgi:polyribonucleotide nucleotidyltransferase